MKRKTTKEFIKDATFDLEFSNAKVASSLIL